MPDDEILERMLEIIKANDKCILATADKNGMPHASLMAHIADEEGKKIYMATLRDTRKFRNIIENPVASLLIQDQRGEKALTLSCSVEVMQDKDLEEQIKKRLATLRPGIASFIADPNVSVLKFEINSLLLLDGPVTSQYRTISNGPSRRKDEQI